MAGTKWVATYEPRTSGKGWHARAELYQATTVVHHMTCSHLHRTQQAAIACARSMVGGGPIPDRVQL